MSRDDAYLLDILLLAKDAREFTRAHTEESFRSDRQCQFAVIRCIEVMGEAAKRLSNEAKEKHPALPWQAMARMRDMLIHSYDKVDIDEVWKTVSRDIPQVIAILEPLFPDA